VDTKEVGKKLVEYCRNGLNLDAISSLYSNDIVSVEEIFRLQRMAKMQADEAAFLR